MDHSQKHRWLFAIMVAPVAVIAVLSISFCRRELTDAALLRRQQVVDLASLVMKDRLDDLMEIVSARVNMQELRTLVAQKRWNEAIKTLHPLLNTDPSVDRLFLADPAGVQWAADPLRPELIGQNFSYRDWYRGVSAQWKPYVSDVYKRTAVPQYNVVAIAAPIRSPSDSAVVVGILVFQVKLDAFLSWSRVIDSAAGTLIFVDRHGQAAVHPDASSTGAIVSLNNQTSVQRVLLGERSVFINPDSDTVVALAPVSHIGWGVILTEPSRSAFAARDRQVLLLIALYGSIFVVVSIMALIIIRMMKSRQFAEDEAWQAKNFLASIVENIPDMIFVKDAKDLRFVLFNRAGETLLGRSRSALIGKNDYDFFPRSQADFFTAKDRLALQSSTVTDIPEEQIQTAQSGEHILHTKKVPICDSTGTPRYLLGISEDITDLKRMEKMKLDFVSLASHQLRTPLSSIRWSSELLQESASAFSDTQKRLIAHVHDASMRMAELIESMLTVSRIEAQSIRGTFASEDIVALLHRIDAEFCSQYSMKRQHFSYDCPATCCIQTDSRLLHEILANLYSNAICYTPDGGSIAVTLREEGTAIRISIADNGIGIPLEEQEMIFQKLYRASNAVDLEVNGTGLGLYIAQSLARTIGATISLSSVLHKGTTVSVMLPRSFAP